MVERGIINTSKTINKSGFVASYIVIFCLPNSSTFSDDMYYSGVDGVLVSAKSSAFVPIAGHFAVW